MRNRKITLTILFILMILMGLDLWFGIFQNSSSNMNPGISINYNADFNRYPSSSKTETFVLPGADISEFIVNNRMGNIVIAGADTNDISVTAHITAHAETEEIAETHLEKLALDVTQEGNSANLFLDNQDNIPDSRGIKVDYNITIPQELDVVATGSFGNMNVANLAGSVQLDGSYGNIRAYDLSGHTQGTFQFATVSFNEISGSINLNTNYSTFDLALVDTPQGYDFNVEVAYGVLQGNIHLQQEVTNSIVRAIGHTSAGENNVQIEARFGNVTMRMN